MCPEPSTDEANYERNEGICLRCVYLNIPNEFAQ